LLQKNRRSPPEIRNVVTAGFGGDGTGKRGPSSGLQKKRLTWTAADPGVGWEKSKRGKSGKEKKGGKTWGS